MDGNSGPLRLLDGRAFRDRFGDLDAEDTAQLLQAVAVLGQRCPRLERPPAQCHRIEHLQLLRGLARLVAAGPARLGLDVEKVYQVITKSAGNSWMFENRMKHVVDGDYRPLSAVNIFTKDLGIIQDMARAANFPVPLSAAALQMFTFASANGMGGDDDSSVARLYAEVTGTKLPPRTDK